ncbi:hypothetical protein Trydic_g16221 [Trypoxylus dichotomus]
MYNLIYIKTRNIAVIPLTPQESGLHDALQNIIVATQQSSMFAFEDVTGSEFDEPAEPHDAQFVEESAENKENNYEDMICVLKEGRCVIDLDYKTRAIEYRKSGKTKLHSLESAKEGEVRTIVIQTGRKC